MRLQPAKLVTVICEGALERLIARDLVTDLGATGYSVCDVRGRGARGEQDARWSLSSNVRFEILCDAPTAARIIQTLLGRYAANYGLVAWQSEVEAGDGPGT